MNAIVSYLKHVRAEFVHVTWPSRRTAISHTLIVILITVATAALAAFLDALFTGALRAFFG
ncbi:preprotein translocase subunit SecE [Patescibacteria group bacterium]|nr:preprotein translocase subunit SecE [Patescibacteria group bacterium]